MNFLRQGFRKLSYYRHTDRETGRNYISRRWVVKYTDHLKPHYTNQGLHTFPAYTGLS